MRLLATMIFFMNTDPVGNFQQYITSERLAN